MAGLALRPLVRADLDAADALLRLTFRAERSFRPRLARYLAIEPTGWFVATDGGAPVGMVGAIDYGAFAYIGLMAVHPELQGRGLGREILDHVLAWIAARGTPSAILEATAAGTPLYLRAGFVDTGCAHELVATAVRDAGPPPDPTAPDVVPSAAAGAAALAELIDLDRDLFGADRSRLWARLATEYGDAIVGVRDRDGALAGYLCVQDSILGPWGARDDGAARALLAAGLARADGRAVRVMVPGDNDGARALLAQHGFTLARSPRHMRRGADVAIDWRRIYGKGSFCVG